jgi:hypothetical protein
MKKTILFFLATFCFVVTTGKGFAQSEPKFAYEIGIGSGSFFGNHNLSPYGIYFREKYSKTGPSINARAFYLFNDKFSAGLKFHGFYTNGNYSDGTNIIIDNIQSYYLAPQAGITYPVNNKISLSASAGAGYLFYYNSGLQGDAENTFFSSQVGGNADFSAEYFLEKKLSIGANMSFLGTLYSGTIYVDKDGKRGHFTLDKWDQLRIYKTDFSLFLRLYL